MQEHRTEDEINAEVDVGYVTHDTVTARDVKVEYEPEFVGVQESRSHVAADSSRREDYKRINLNLAPRAYHELRALADIRGRTISDVIRDALVLSRWFYEVTHEEGTHLLIERNGKQREILPLQ